MRHFLTQAPPPDAGHLLGDDLDQMTDDRCPLAHDPAREADSDWRDNLGESDTFDTPPEEPAAPVPANPPPREQIKLWSSRTSEGFARYPHPVSRVGRFRTLGEVFTLVLVCVGVGYLCSGWELSGWLALSMSLLVVVGWVLELVYQRAMDNQFRDLLTNRWDRDMSSAPITQPRPQPRPTDA